MRGFTYPRYVWLSYGWYQDKWWTSEINPRMANCTDSQLAGFLERGLALQILPMAQDLDAMTDTGLVGSNIFCWHMLACMLVVMIKMLVNECVACITF